MVFFTGNYLDIVQMLLEHKPNVNALDKDGCTALTLACKEGYFEIAVALLNSGAYINIQVCAFKIFNSLAKSCFGFDLSSFLCI